MEGQYYSGSSDMPINAIEKFNSQLNNSNMTPSQILTRRESLEQMALTTIQAEQALAAMKANSNGLVTAVASDLSIGSDSYRDTFFKYEEDDPKYAAPFYPTKDVYLLSCDDCKVQVDAVIINMCPTAKHILSGRTSAFRNTLGGSTFNIEQKHVILKKEGRILASLVEDTAECSVLALPEVKGSTLVKVIEYCAVEGRPCGSDDMTLEEKIQWEHEFVDLEQAALCELASAAYYLDVKPLVNLTSRQIASQISGKTTEELRETFNLHDEPMLDPQEAAAGAYSAKYRLKRKLKGVLGVGADEEQDGEDGDVLGVKAIEAPPVEDTRSVDELMQFIDGKGEATAAKKARKKAKKKNKKGNKQQTHSEHAPAPEPAKAAAPPALPVPDKVVWADEDGSEDELDKEIEEFRQRLEQSTGQPEQRMKLPNSLFREVASMMR